jgi:hypothetical protein
MWLHISYDEELKTEGIKSGELLYFLCTFRPTVQKTSKGTEFSLISWVKNWTEQYCRDRGFVTETLQYKIYTYRI